MTIDPPSLPPGHPDRVLECEEAMEQAIEAVIDEALGAGWTDDEIATAIVSLVENIRLKRQSIAETERDIARAGRRH